MGTRDCLSPPTFIAIYTPKDQKIVAYLMLCRVQSHGDDSHQFDIKLQVDDSDSQVFDFAIQTLEDICKKHRITRLLKQESIDCLTTLENFQRNGYEVRHRSRKLVVETHHALSVFQKAMTKLTISSKILAGINITLYSENKQAVSALCQSRLGQLTHEHLAAIGEYPSKFDYSLSQVMWLNDQIVASLGIGTDGTDGNIAHLDPFIIAKEFTSTWVFPYFIHHCLKILHNHNIEKLQLHILESDNKMMRFISKLKSNVLSRQAAIVKELTNENS
ncbi:hypothetical protein [Paraglaciecola aestuariivivens]